MLDSYEGGGVWCGWLFTPHTVWGEPDRQQLLELGTVGHCLLCGAVFDNPTPEGTTCRWRIRWRGLRGAVGVEPAPAVDAGSDAGGFTPALRLTYRLVGAPGEVASCLCTGAIGGDDDGEGFGDFQRGRDRFYIHAGECA